VIEQPRHNKAGVFPLSHYQLSQWLATNPGMCTRRVWQAAVADIKRWDARTGSKPSSKPGYNKAFDRTAYMREYMRDLRRGGRPLVGTKPMTAAERMRRHRARKACSKMQDATIRGRGRPRVGDKPMSVAERVRRHRARKHAS
jgi:hypothetical protein